MPFDRVLVNHSITAAAHVALKSFRKNSCSPDLNCREVNSNEDIWNQSKSPN